MLLTTILDWFKVPKEGNGLHPVVGLVPSHLGLADPEIYPQPVKEKIVENNAWYKEQWATDFMGTIASVVFKTPAEAPVVSPQQPVKTTDLGAKIEFGDWTLVVSIISIVALILLFFFLRQRGRAY